MYMICTYMQYICLIYLVPRHAMKCNFYAAAVGPGGAPAEGPEDTFERLPKAPKRLCKAPTDYTKLQKKTMQRHNVLDPPPKKTTTTYKYIQIYFLK